MDLSKIPAGKTYAIPQRQYFVITEGEAPLADDVGFFVHTATENEVAYYAVTAIAGGTETTTLDTNALRTPIAERVAPVSAVRQNNEVDYVHWTAGAADQPATAYNFRVHAPTGRGPFALIGVLHGALFQYNTPDRERYAKLDGEEGDRAVRVSLDAPLIRGKIEGIDLPAAGGGMPRGWFGAEARVLWTLDWVAGRYPIDRARFALRGESMGGMGSIAIALAHPEKFAAFHAYVPAFGSEQPTEGGRGMMRFDAYGTVKKNPRQDFPFILYTAGRADHIVQWPDKVEFAAFAQRQHLGAIFYWDTREHAYGTSDKYVATWGEPGGRPTVDLTRFSTKQSYPAVANLSVNDDLGTNNVLARRPAERGPLDSPGLGDLVGTINGQVEWDRDTIVDQSDHYEITLRLTPLAKNASATADVTPRRLQRFTPQAGAVYRVSVTAGGKSLLAGSTTADEHGRVQIKGVPLTKDGTRLRIAK
jgi:hypothetical protein